MSLLDPKVLISSRPPREGKRNCGSDTLCHSNLLTHRPCAVPQKTLPEPSFPCLLHGDPRWTRGWVGTSARSGCPHKFQIAAIIMTMTLVHDVVTLATMKPSEHDGAITPLWKAHLPPTGDSHSDWARL